MARRSKSSTVPVAVRARRALAAFADAGGNLLVRQLGEGEGEALRRLEAALTLADQEPKPTPAETFVEQCKRVAEAWLAAKARYPASMNIKDDSLYIEASGVYGFADAFDALHAAEIDLALAALVVAADKLASSFAEFCQGYDEDVGEEGYTRRVEASLEFYPGAGVIDPIIARLRAMGVVLEEPEDAAED